MGKMAECSVLSEDALADDEAVEKKLCGTLSFANDTEVTKPLHKDASLSAIASEEFHGLVSRPGPISIRFDVIDAKIEAAPNEKYVVYTVLLIRSSGMDSMPAKIERRYTEFSGLNTALRKRFPLLMKEISFPSKRLSGNFRAQTIASRSRSFEQYLSHLFSIEVIRVSPEFTDFFYGHSLREAHRLIQNSLYVDAIPLLLSTWKLQTKLLGDFHRQAVATLCAVVACHSALDQDQQADMYAELALESIADDNHNPYLGPLLKLSIRLRWKLGKDKKQLEARLKILKDSGCEIDGAPSLLEQVISRFKV